jgi:Lipoprotein LpqB beta-propeller domain/Sporulation and spore germination
MMRRWWVVGVLILVSALTGCVEIPDGGAVHNADDAGAVIGEAEGRYVPRAPQEHESAPDIVTHFLEAMTARPMSVAVAREFLTKSAAESWNPEDGYLVYESKSAPEGDADLEVSLTGVNRFDSRGQWTGTPPGRTRRLGFAMEKTGGEWRIASAPDALVVSADWFASQARPMSIYYFDPAALTLVPEPVFVPQGDQQATLLIQALLEGPTDPRIERTFVPEGTSLNLSVTVSPGGIADIPLRGDLSELPLETLEKMEVQFAWTLHQVSSITEIRITVGGHPLPLPGDTSNFSVYTGSNYDPAGTNARGEIYGLSDGLAMRVLDGKPQTLLGGPFGQRRYGLRDVSVDLDANQVAGVTEDGQQVILASVAETDGLAPRTIISGAVDILHPAWDLSHRMWVLDRRHGDAAVSVFVNDRLVSVDVPGITGHDAIDFLVSRDGTRIVATIRGRGSDRIVMSRTFTAGPKSTVHATRAQTIVEGKGEQLRIRDIGWRAPTEIYYLKALAGRQSELLSAIVDGSPVQFDPNAVSSIPGDLGAKVISSPRQEERPYLQKPAGGFESIVAGSPPLAADASALHYVG